MIKTLNDRTIRALKPRTINGELRGYEVHDRTFPGLCLRVLPTGVKSWSLRFNVDGRARRIALGRYPILRLADARDVATEHMRAVKKEARDPSREKREQRNADLDTFAALAARYVEQYAKKRKKHWKYDKHVLDNIVPRYWHQRLAREIT